MELAAGERESLGIIYASHLGPVSEVHKYVDDLLTYAPEECSPALFSQSVFNAPVACLTHCLGIHGPCLSVCGFQSIAVSSVMTACAWLQSACCGKVLLICSDESAGIACKISEMTGMDRFKFNHFLLLAGSTKNEKAPFFTPEELIEHIRNQHQLRGI